MMDGPVRKNLPNASRAVRIFSCSSPPALNSQSPRSVSAGSLGSNAAMRSSILSAPRVHQTMRSNSFSHHSDAHAYLHVLHDEACFPCIIAGRCYMAKDDSTTSYGPGGRGFYGAVTVGERGQIVIPAQARRDLGIEAGDRLLVLGDPDRGLGLANLERLMQTLPNSARRLQQRTGRRDR